MAGSKRVIDCPHAPDDLGRPCMRYKLCGCHIFGMTFEDIIGSVDGFPCPHSAGDHLYLRQPGLVVPTRECQVAWHENVLLPTRISDGDWVIESWHERGPYLEVALAQEPAELLAAS